MSAPGKAYLDTVLRDSTPEHTITVRWQSQGTWRAYCTCRWQSISGAKYAVGLIGAHHITDPVMERTAW